MLMPVSLHVFRISAINLRTIKTKPSKDTEGRVADIWGQISPEVKAMTSGMGQAEGLSIIFSLPLVTAGTRAECVRKELGVRSNYDGQGKEGATQGPGCSYVVQGMLCNIMCLFFVF